MFKNVTKPQQQKQLQELERVKDYKQHKKMHIFYSLICRILTSV